MIAKSRYQRHFAINVLQEKMVVKWEPRAINPGCREGSNVVAQHTSVPRTNRLVTRFGTKRYKSVLPEFGRYRHRRRPHYRVGRQTAHHVCRRSISDDYYGDSVTEIDHRVA